MKAELEQALRGEMLKAEQIESLFRQFQEMPESPSNSEVIPEQYAEEMADCDNK
jgi:hypothetical protein